MDGPFGSNLKVEEYVESGVPLLRVQNVKDGWIDESTLVYITPEKQHQLRRSRVLPGNVVLTKAGTIGFSAVFPRHLGEGNITSHLANIVPKEGIDPEYLATYLSSRYGKLQVRRWGNKTTRPELNISEVGNLIVIVPDIETQAKIVNMMKSAYVERDKKLQEAEEAVTKAASKVEAMILGQE